MDTMILAVIAITVFIVLIGPVVAIGAVIDARSAGKALREFRAAAARAADRAADQYAHARECWATWERRAGEQRARAHTAECRVTKLEHEVEDLRAQLAAADAALDTVSARATKLADDRAVLRAEAASLRKQRRFLVESKAADVRGLVADVEGASAEAEAQRSLAEYWRNAASIRQDRIAKANLGLVDARMRINQLERFIETAYGPLDECDL